MEAFAKLGHLVQDALTRGTQNEWHNTQLSATPGFLSRERTIAGPGFSRWMVPPAALAIHLCIGMAYGFSVFWLPLSKAIGITAVGSLPG